jgi:hypothetical protein
MPKKTTGSGGRVCMQLNPNVPLHADLHQKLEQLKDLAAAGSIGEVALRILIRNVDGAFSDPAINLKYTGQAQPAPQQPTSLPEVPESSPEPAPEPIPPAKPGLKQKGPLTLNFD